MERNKLLNKIVQKKIDNIDGLEDADFKQTMKNISSISQEEEEGRIGIKLYSGDLKPYNGNICLRRADSHDNFSSWIDTKSSINEFIPWFFWEVSKNTIIVIIKS